jgi:hypothetical protein
MAASVTAPKQMAAHRSEHAAMRRQSLRRPKAISMRWRWRSGALSEGDRPLAARLGRDAGGGAVLGERGVGKVAVVAAVGDQLARRREQRGENVDAPLARSSALRRAS